MKTYSNSHQAIKARLQRRLVTLHELAFTYMKQRYGTRKFARPKIKYFDDNHANAHEHGDVFALADFKAWTIHIHKAVLDLPWVFIEEILAHEMAHVALFRVKNYSHDIEWKRCALYLGSTAARTYCVPRKNQKETFGIYTYTRKNRHSVKVLGRPFDSYDYRVSGFRLSQEITAGFSLNATLKNLERKRGVHINFVN